MTASVVGEQDHRKDQEAGAQNRIWQDAEGVVGQQLRYAPSEKTEGAQDMISEDDPVARDDSKHVVLVHTTAQAFWGSPSLSPRIRSSSSTNHTTRAANVIDQ